MTETMKTVPVIAGLLMLLGAPGAQAQTLTPQPETGAFISLAVGGQPLKRTFGSGGTFTSFNETGRYEINQNIGAGAMVDVALGYNFKKHLSAGLSLWNVRSKSATAAAASVPDPVFFGRFNTLTATNDTDQEMSVIGVNLFVAYTRPVGDRFDFTIALGPTVVRTTLDVGIVTVTPSNTIELSSEREIKASAKAGNLSLDLGYRVNAMYTVGIFVRYAGGEVDMPAVSKLRVGGIQTGGVIKYRF